MPLEERKEPVQPSHPPKNSGKNYPVPGTPLADVPLVSPFIRRTLPIALLSPAPSPVLLISGMTRLHRLVLFAQDIMRKLSPVVKSWRIFSSKQASSVSEKTLLQPKAAAKPEVCSHAESVASNNKCLKHAAGNGEARLEKGK